MAAFTAPIEMPVMTVGPEALPVFVKGLQDAAFEGTEGTPSLEDDCRTQGVS
jgi:hypothetical protein